MSDKTVLYQVMQYIKEEEKCLPLTDLMSYADADRFRDRMRLDMLAGRTESDVGSLIIVGTNTTLNNS